MLLKCDASGIEWRVAVDLSGDEIGIKEIHDGLDPHSDNQRRLSLPDRTTAKIFLFRLIYGGSAYGYANDPDFGYLGSESYWQEKIDAFFAKYQGLYAYNERLVEHVIKHGIIRIPTGREYEFDQQEVAQDTDYWRSKIINYPTQGFAADLMLLVRRAFRKNLREAHNPYILPINFVHDEILLDIKDDARYNKNTIQAIKILLDSYQELPSMLETYFNYRIKVPITCEISVGEDWKNMIPYQQFQCFQEIH